MGLFVDYCIFRYQVLFVSHFSDVLFIWTFKNILEDTWSLSLFHITLSSDFYFSFLLQRWARLWSRGRDWDQVGLSLGLKLFCSILILFLRSLFSFCFRSYCFLIFLLLSNPFQFLYLSFLIMSLFILIPFLFSLFLKLLFIELAFRSNSILFLFPFRYSCCLKVFTIHKDT